MANNFCTQCGKRLRPGARFCTQCGKMVTGYVEPIQIPPVETASWGLTLGIIGIVFVVLSAISLVI